MFVWRLLDHSEYSHVISLFKVSKHKLLYNQKVSFVYYKKKIKVHHSYIKLGPYFSTDKSWSPPPPTP